MKGQLGASRDDGDRLMLCTGSPEIRTVRSPSGTDLGRIEELMIEPASGRIAYAVLSLAGFLKIGYAFAVPWESLSLSDEEDCFVLRATAEEFEAAAAMEDTPPPWTWSEHVAPLHDRADPGWQ